MAAHVGGDVDPFVVVFDGLFARGLGVGADVARAVNHDEEDLDVVGGRVLNELVDVGFVGGREHAVDEFDGLDAEFLSREFGHVEHGRLAVPGADGAV